MVDTQASEGEWRVEKGPWHPFCKSDDGGHAEIWIECSGLEPLDAAAYTKIEAVVDAELIDIAQTVSGACETEGDHGGFYICAFEKGVKR